MKIAFLFAGQGSQKPGMGADFYAEFPQVRPIFDAQPMGIPLKQLCFDGPMESLSQTRFTQPAMAAFAAAVTQLLKEQGVTPDYAAGLSLGEYSALHAAGAFDAPTLLDLLAFRGSAMTETTTGMDSAMAAIFGMEENAIQDVLSAFDGKAFCCNFNCPGQIVIGGERSAVEAAAQKCLENGAKRSVFLNVSGPFHTPFMEQASRLLAGKLAEVEFAPRSCPVFSNVTGDVLPDDVDLREMLVLQVKSPVRFEQILKNLAERGVDVVIEIGPGKVLSGFVQKTAPGIRRYSIETIADFSRVVQELQEG